MNTPLKFQVDKDIFPFESRFFHSDSTGATVHYIDEGASSDENNVPPTATFLMLHGNPTWSFVYRKLITHLLSSENARIRCIALDYPGFGLSTAPADDDYLPATHAQVVQELVEYLDLKDYILVAQDWGGPIGLWVAQQDPSRVKGLVLGNTWAWPLKGIRRFEVFSWLMGGPIGRLAAFTFNGVWLYFIKAGFVYAPSEREMNMYRAPFQRRSDRRPTWIFPRQLVKSYDFEAQVQADMNSLADKLVLLLWGTKDFAFQEAARDRFMAVFPRHVYHPLEASHFWQDDQGTLAAQYILDWIDDAMKP